MDFRSGMIRVRLRGGDDEWIRRGSLPAWHGDVHADFRRAELSEWAHVVAVADVGELAPSDRQGVPRP